VTVVRLATNQDKDHVLNFCKSTFSWGDYIDRVWNIWISEPNSILLVAEENENHTEKKPIAIIHGILIPEKTIWIEGIRVDPEFRKQNLATKLINSILEFGRKNGAIYSAAIVSIKNEASKKLMEKSGFKVLSKWSYISTNHMIILPTTYNLTENFKIADINDYQQISNFLRNSKIFESSGKKFVKSWRWHELTEDKLFTMIHNKKVIIVKKNDKNRNHRDDNNNNNDDDNKDELQIRGIAIIDIERYWNNENIFQIVFIDANSEKLLTALINKSLQLTLNNNEKINNNNNNNNITTNKFERIQLFSPYREYNSKIFNESDISFSEQFLLYYKKYN
jgi:GNAT superfamily N-acetyltransferase